MASNAFNALLAEGSSKEYSVALKQMPAEALPPGEVLVEVIYSSLNYKDGLAVTAKGRVILCKFPMVLGIDLCGASS